MDAFFASVKLDVTTNLRGLLTASQTAAEIRRRILEETGLSAWAGISDNEFLAKLASGQNRPDRCRRSQRWRGGSGSPNELERRPSGGMSTIQANSAEVCSGVLRI